MDKRPIVGVTGNDRRWAPAWWCSRIVLWLAGARAVRISLAHTPVKKNMAALVVGGGNDISPEHYGGDIEAKVKLDPGRDQLEIEWIEYALRQKIPLLGICRGAQLINVVLGGSLHQDIRSMRKRTYNRPGLLPTKRVSLEEGSLLSSLFEKTRIKVNSLHHQAIKQPGRGLRVAGRDRDQIIQAVESDDGKPIVGVQWHPEYLFYVSGQRAIFHWLLQNICPKSPQ